MAASNGAMTPTDARRRLRRLGPRIDATNSKLDGLYAERLEAFEVLSGEGVTQAEIAQLAGVTPMAVAFALHKKRKRDGV